jgi:hypothetical protein
MSDEKGGKVEIEHSRKVKISLPFSLNETQILNRGRKRKNVEKGKNFRYCRKEKGKFPRPFL